MRLEVITRMSVVLVIDCGIDFFFFWFIIYHLLVFCTFDFSHSYLSLSQSSFSSSLNSFFQKGPQEGLKLNKRDFLEKSPIWLIFAHKKKLGKIVVVGHPESD